MKSGIGKLVIVLLLVLAIMAVGGCQAGNRPVADTDPAATNLQGLNQAAEAKTADSGQDCLDENSTDDETAQQAVNGKTGEPDDSQASPSNSTEQISLLITRDFGRQSLMDNKAPITGRGTILDVLQSQAQVETKWDGSFVNGINGLQANSGGLSGKRTDWFFFINGICADVGASDYHPQSGDMVWWDYRLWGDMGTMNAAVIGCYPGPFIHGYRGSISPTTVMSSAANQSLSQKLQSALKSQGVTAVQSSTLSNELLQNRAGPVVVLGTWDELKQLPALDSLNKSYRKTGVSVHFVDNGVELLDGRSNVARQSGLGTGIIAATGSGLGDPKVLWLIVGTDAEGLNSAVDLLVNRPAQIRGFYQAAVISGSAVRLPLE